MRPTLRRTLIQLVLAATPLAAGGCVFDDGDPCSELRERNVRLPEPPPMDLVALVDACEADEARCIELCTAVLHQTNSFSSPASCEVTHDATGHDVGMTYFVSTGASGCPVDGRRPAGLARARKPRAGITGTHLARSAWYEAASVHAFVGLARQLARHGAPAALRDAAKRAAIDEVHHARLMGELARARGATPPRVEIEVQGRRSLESIAIENVTEGVVGETWAALIAFWQAAHATDPKVRATYAKIAEDELRHAELSIEVDAWARAKLRPAAQRRVEAARTRALAKLAKGVKAEVPTALVADLGMPDAHAMQKLFADARARVWA
jgi:hypothetical protein